jgi:RNA polymerase sigma factor (sigma-70 family)
MKTEAMLEAPLLTDARLVELSLEGDRDAFGQLVTRHQAPVCALAYSACGSISRSEDLAQEVFITAWRQLRGLREPGSFKAWLFGITRNLLNKSFYRQTRNPLTAAEPLDEKLEPGPETSSPAEVAITREEEAIMWRVLEAMPETYREPMVLFYRQDESIAKVAEVLGVSEEAARQRLSRGRAMLNERVAQVVEHGLRRSGPSEAFGLAVLGALPLLATPAKAALVSATAVGAKSTSLQGLGTSAFATVAYLAAALGAAAGGIFAILGRFCLARSPRERKFLARCSLGFFVWWVAFAVTFGSHDIIINDWRAAVAWGWVWLTLFGCWVVYAIWVSHRQKAIRMEEGTFAGGLLTGGEVDATRKGFKAAVYGSLAAFIFVEQFIMAKAAHNDWPFLILLQAYSIGVWLVSARAIVRRPEKAGSVLYALWWIQTLFVLGAVNLRWNVWAIPPQSFKPLPLFVTCIILGLSGSFGVAWWLERRLLKTTNFKRDAAVALGSFVTLVLLGLILLVCRVSKFYIAGTFSAS